MAGPRAEKVAVVEEVKNHLEQADAAILTEYRGLKVADLAALRRALRGAGAEYKIYKNTLVRRATAETGRSGIDSLLEGPTGIAFVEKDVAAVAKVLREFARTNPALVVKGSLVGTSVYDAASTSRLAELPSREVLLSQIAGALAAPMQQFAALLKALPQNLAYGLSALIDQRVAGGEAAPAAPAAEEAPTAEEPVAAAADEESAPVAVAEEAAPEASAEEAPVAATDGEEPAAEAGDAE